MAKVRRRPLSDGISPAPPQMVCRRSFMRSGWRRERRRASASEEPSRRRLFSNHSQLQPAFQKSAQCSAEKPFERMSALKAQFSGRGDAVEGGPDTNSDGSTTAIRADAASETFFSSAPNILTGVR